MVQRLFALLALAAVVQGATPWVAQGPFNVTDVYACENVPRASHHFKRVTLSQCGLNFFLLDLNLDRPVSEATVIGAVTNIVLSAPDTAFIGTVWFLSRPFLSPST